MFPVHNTQSENVIWFPRVAEDCRGRVNAIGAFVRFAAEADALLEGGDELRVPEGSR